jgi:hypothetical protein
MTERTMIVTSRFRSRWKKHKNLSASHGCETRSPINVFDNGVLRRIFWPKGAEITGEQRRMHSEELHRF